MSKAGSRILQGAYEALVLANDEAEDKPVIATVAPKARRSQALQSEKREVPTTAPTETNERNVTARV